MRGLDEFKSKVEKADNILLIFPYILNSDVCASISLFYKFLISENKTVNVASSREIPERFHNILEKSGIKLDEVHYEIKPVSYIISVNDSPEGADVKWEEKDGKIKFLITPESGEINFSKISFGREGGLFDLVITFESISLSNLGDLYSLSEAQFDNFEITSINNLTDNVDFAKVTLFDDTATLSELIYNLVESLGYTVDDVDVEVLLEGILGSTYGLHRVTDSRTFALITELLTNHDIDISKINNKYFYSLSKKDFNLRQKLFQNTVFDYKNKIIYSTLTSKDFTNLNLTPNDLDGMDYLPFNICEGYDHAFLAYENGKNTTILIHSNLAKDEEFSKNLRELNSFYNKNYGVIVSDKNLHDAIQSVITKFSNDSQSDEVQNDQGPTEEISKDSLQTDSNIKEINSNPFLDIEEMSELEVELESEPETLEPVQQTQTQSQIHVETNEVSNAPTTHSPFEKAKIEDITKISSSSNSIFEKAKI